MHWSEWLFLYSYLPFFDSKCSEEDALTQLMMKVKLRECNYSIQRLCKCRMQINWELLLFIPRPHHVFRNLAARKWRRVIGIMVRQYHLLQVYHLFYVSWLESQINGRLATVRFSGRAPCVRNSGRVQFPEFDFHLFFGFPFHSTRARFLFRTDKIKQE